MNTITSLAPGSLHDPIVSLDKGNKHGCEHPWAGSTMEHVCGRGEESRLTFDHNVTMFGSFCDCLPFQSLSTDTLSRELLSAH